MTNRITEDEAKSSAAAIENNCHMALSLLPLVTRCKRKFHGWVASNVEAEGRRR
jgi:hypothetical protein